MRFEIARRKSKAAENKQTPMVSSVGKNYRSQTDLTMKDVMVLTDMNNNNNI